MNTQVEQPITLSGRSVWIIDNDIPIQSADFEKDDMVQGMRPIDRGTLLSLLRKEEEWRDPAVLALCKELINKMGDINGFILPTGAIEYLKKGAKAPDIIIFDMDYGSLLNKEKVLEFLKIILKGYISLVQVYSKEGIDTINRDLGPFVTEYKRLQPTLLKDQTNAEKLETIITQKLSSSLSAQLGTNVRRLSTIAIEQVLVEIDNLPVNTAIRVLTGEEEGIGDVELVELLSTKIGDYLKSSRELAEAMLQYGRKLGVPADKEKHYVDEAIDIFATAIRNRIQYDKWLYDAIRSTKDLVEEEKIDCDQTKNIVRNFFAFRVYDQPGDDWVRTGDIISFDADYPAYYHELFLVLTPGCDLARFWKKTRGLLTLARMQPVDKDGIEQIKKCNNNEFNNTSITSKNPFVLPSVLIPDHGQMDYLLFSHEITNKKIKEPEVKPGSSSKEKKSIFERQLTYTEIRQSGENIQRYCRVSEPFLSGIMSEIGTRLFRVGVPDFPTEEATRIKKLV
jgi:hypothetical protein